MLVLLLFCSVVQVYFCQHRRVARVRFLSGFN